MDIRLKKLTCPYCGENNNDDHKLIDFYITNLPYYHKTFAFQGFITENGFLSVQILDASGEVKINYCPMCGRRLV